MSNSPCEPARPDPIYGDKIGRNAICGADAKEAEVKAFTGAGLRPTPVKFFTAAETEAARAWLLESDRSA